MKEKRMLLQAFKITLSAIVAIMVSQWLGLDNAVSAGIVTILTIQPTKKETFRTALERFLAFIVALLIARATFFLLGFTTWGFFLYLALFVLICQKFGWYSSMAMDSVIISHFMGFGDMGWRSLSNEMLIFVIGIAAGIIANLHLNKDRKLIERLKRQMDDQIRLVLRTMAEILRDENREGGIVCQGNCLVELDGKITEAAVVAKANYDNQFGSKDVFDMRYIAMRRRQSYILQEMYKNVMSLKQTPETVGLIADFLMTVYREYDIANPVISLMEKFNALDLQMKSKPLPVTRTEFEDRAQLYVLLRKTEEFLEIKKVFMK